MLSVLLCVVLVQSLKDPSPCHPGDQIGLCGAAKLLEGGFDVDPAQLDWGASACILGDAPKTC